MHWLKSKHWLFDFNQIKKWRWLLVVPFWVCGKNRLWEEKQPDEHWQRRNDAAAWPEDVDTKQWAKSYHRSGETGGNGAALWSIVWHNVCCCGQGCPLCSTRPLQWSPEILDSLQCAPQLQTSAAGAIPCLSYFLHTIPDQLWPRFFIVNLGFSCKTLTGFAEMCKKC